MLYDELDEFSRDSRGCPDFDLQEVIELEKERQEYAGIMCKFGHFKPEYSDCGACARLSIKKREEKERQIQFRKEEKTFMDTVIGLTEFAIKKSIPSEIVGEICTFFSVISKNANICRKTGQEIYIKMNSMLTIKKRVAECSSIADYKEQHKDLLQDGHKYAEKLFNKRLKYVCILL
jgi:hypothetical protein